MQQVRKVYENGFEAVRGATFEIADGEFVVLVGPSGCGKSTTLRMVAGLESVTDGEIWIGDRMVNDIPPKDRDIAMVFQNYALYPHMTVFDNMAFGLKLRKYPKSQIKERVEFAARTLGIEPILDRKPKQLSGGQRQRVAVGRAIVRKPEVFLFDEPLSNLDAKLRVQMRTEISKLHRELDATMIYVTHDQVEAMTMGDRIVVMNEGEIMQIDAPLTLYNAPANQFVASFIGSPAMNFVVGELREGSRFESADGAIALPGISLASNDADGQITIGVRPEDVLLGAEQKSNGTIAVGKATLEVVEPMGNEIVLYASTPESNLVLRLPPQPIPEIGSSFEIAFVADRVHYFATSSGEVLRPSR